MGNIVKKTIYGTKNADGYYISHDTIDTFNGHKLDEHSFNLQKKTKYRNEHKIKKMRKFWFS